MDIIIMTIDEDGEEIQVPIFVETVPHFELIEEFEEYLNQLKV